MGAMDDILKALLPGEIVSGARISKALGITRAAVWKRITALRERGFVIDSLDRQGYLLVHVPDVLMSSLITYGLETKWAGSQVFCYESVDSTNRVLRTMAADGAGHGTLVVANEQTGGRGRRGRGWLTPKDTSIAMSLLLRPEIPPAKVALLSLAASVAVAKGIRQVTGLEAGIKWPNDIVVNGKKVCGILLEMDADEQNVHYIVAGAGINVHLMDIPEEIRATATSLDLELGHPCSRVEIVKAVMRATEETENLLRDGSFMSVYETLSVTLGHPVSVQGVGETFTGTAEQIREDGVLMVRTESGAVREVMAGDVSVRGLMGYV